MSSYASDHFSDMFMNIKQVKNYLTEFFFSMSYFVDPKIICIDRILIFQ